MEKNEGDGPSINASEFAQNMGSAQARGLASAALPYASSLAQTGMAKVSQQIDNFELYVQQGPEGIQYLAFVGGVLTMCYGVVSILAIFQIFSTPFYYIMCVSQLPFGLATVALEAPARIVESWPSVDKLQKEFHDHCQVLTLVPGRGAFYVYLGAHICFLSGTISIGMILGLYMILMGAFYLSAHWGMDISKPVGGLLDGLRWIVQKIRALLGRPSREAEPHTDNHYVRV